MEYNKTEVQRSPIEEVAEELMRLLADKSDADQAGEILIALRQRAFLLIKQQIELHNGEILEIQKRIEALEYSAKTIQVSM
jgi:hypothetical protein